jgi:hypothetical protein
VAADILPNPFTDDDQTAGYRYELLLLQTEFSLTQMLSGCSIPGRSTRPSRTMPARWRSPTDWEGIKHR